MFRYNLFWLLCLFPMALLGNEAVDFTSKLEAHHWLKDLSGDDWVLQSVALEELGKRKVESALPLIREILREGKSSWMRGQAMMALGKISGKEIIPLARKATREDDPILRISAIRTLELVGGGDSSELALALMKDPVTEVRAMAAALYAKQFPAQAWPTVESLTRMGSGSISSGLLRALAHVGTPEALARLNDLFLESNGTGERPGKIIKALGSADDRAIELLASLTIRFPAQSAEFQLGSKLLNERARSKTSPVLKSLIEKDDPAGLAGAAALLAEVCPTRRMGDLLSKSWTERNIPLDAVRAGMIALSRIDPVRYESFFNKRLASEDIPTRALAVSCRALVPDRGLFETFRPFVNDRESKIVLVALNGLRRTPEGAKPEEGLVSYLRPSLKSPQEDILFAALDLLGKRAREEEFVEALGLMAPVLSGSEKRVREAAASALSRFCPPDRIGEIAIAQGFGGSWLVVGPFPSDNKNKGFDEIFEPENNWNAPNYKAPYRWEFGGGNDERELDLSWVETAPENVNGEVHLAAKMPVPVKYAVAYAKSRIKCDKKREVRFCFELREETAQRVWLNGKEIASFAVERNSLGGSVEQRRLGIPRQTKTMKVELSEGVNELSFKSSTFGGDWRISLRVLDTEKNRRADGISFLAYPKEKPE